jgi:hypothetical protein
MSVQHLNGPITTTETPSTMKPSPAPAAVVVASLETRIGALKQELIAKLTELQDGAEDGVAEARDKIKARLSELAHIVKAGVVDGWENINAATTAKLDSWLAK